MRRRAITRLKKPSLERIIIIRSGMRHFLAANTTEEPRIRSSKVRLQQDQVRVIERDL